MKYHVSYFVLIELDEEDSYNAERVVKARIPNIQELQEAGLKIRSHQWTVTELDNDSTSNRPTE